MNQSAVYHVSKRVLDEAEDEFPVKRPCLHPIAAHRFVVGSSNSPVNKPPVIAGASPVEKPPPVIAPKLPVTRLLPVSKPPVIVRHGDGRETWTVFERKEAASEDSEPTYKERTLRFSTSIDENSPKVHPLRTHMLQAFMPEDFRAALQREAEELAEAKKRGYTEREYNLCRGYLFKRTFEKSSEKSPEKPMPRLYRDLKKYLDQIRDTRGYGLTRSPPYIDDDPMPITAANFQCRIYRYKDEDPWVLKYVKKMEEMVLGEIRQKMGKTYICAGLVNLVECNDNIRLCTFHVHEEGTAPATEGQPVEIAEARFLMLPIRPILDRIELEEWKIRKGEEVLFSTVEMNGGKPRL